MLSPTLAAITRLLGLFIAISLIISPWLVTVQVQDPFLNQNWLLLGLAFLGGLLLAGLLPFYKPRAHQVPLLPALGIFWLGIIASTLASGYSESLRACLVVGGQLLIFLFLRLFQRRTDVFALAFLITISGFGMAGVAIAQWRGFDVFVWGPHRIVGTFGNPNFLGAYLLVTALLTVNLLVSPRPGVLTRAILAVSLPVQLAGILLSNCKAAWLCFFLGLLISVLDIGRIGARPFGRIGYLGGGLGLTALLVLLYAGVHQAVSRFPWETLQTPPYGYFSLVTRLLLHAMGFAVFRQSPWLGTGLGSSPYQLSAHRPEFGVFLGLDQFNNDPHAFPLLVLAETGVVGLFGCCTLLSAVVGIHGWKRMREGAQEARDREGQAVLKFSVLRPGLFAAPLGALVCLALFNNALSTLPIANTALILLALHQGTCLRDVRWKWRFSLVLLPYLVLPLLFGLFAWHFQGAHHRQEKLLYDGQMMLAGNDTAGADKALEDLVRVAPQSIHGLYHLAAVKERQDKAYEAQEILARLDLLAPNAFGLHFHIARLFFERGMNLEAHKWALSHVSRNRSPSGYELLGKILIQVGRPAEAEAAFEEAITRIPYWIEREKEPAQFARLYLATIRLDQNRVAEAQKLLSQLTPPLTDFPEYYFQQGLAAFKSGQASAAVNLFEKAYQKNSADPKYANALGYVLVKTDSDLGRAQTLLEGAYQAFRSRTPPVLSDILGVTHSLGILYWKQGHLAKSRELLTIAAQQTPELWPQVRKQREADLERLLQEMGKPVSGSGTPP
jgi:tetratricopeptide (TPR) repeat protein